MAIIFQEEIKKQRNLIYIFFFIVIITAIIVWYGFFRKGTPSLENQPELTSKKVQINFEIFQNPILENLQPFEGLPPLSLDEKFGRENPFFSIRFCDWLDFKAISAVVQYIHYLVILVTGIAIARATMKDQSMAPPPGHAPSGKARGMWS